MDIACYRTVFDVLGYKIVQVSVVSLFCTKNKTFCLDMTYNQKEKCLCVRVSCMRQAKFSLSGALNTTIHLDIYVCLFFVFWGVL